jgi:hypothetical protein
MASESHKFLLCFDTHHKMLERKFLQVILAIFFINFKVKFSRNGSKYLKTLEPLPFYEGKKAS